MSQSTYRVTGMTCSHCADAVTRELSAVDGVQDVQISVETGTLLVIGEAVRDEDVRAAVDEAGYEVA
jgi:copper chaperone